ncbi:MAG: phosphatidate cytidylyltransferase [Azospirillaceae bacterium]
MAGARDDTAPSSPRRRSGNLAQRLVSAAVMIPVALAAIFLGGAVFALLLALLLAAGALEYHRLTGEGRARSVAELGAAGVIVVILAFAAGGWPALLAVLTVALGAVAIATRGATGATLLAGGGIVYLAAPGIALVGLRATDEGLTLVLAVVLAVWATDTGAYMAGRSLGGPKLWPRLSPSKTWSGLAGGILAAAAVLALVAGIQGGAAIALAVVVGAFSALVAQAGDLFESWLKRRVGAKDSGTLIPGHGGVLDRIDGLIAAAPAFALVHLGLAGSGMWWP